VNPFAGPVRKRIFLGRNVRLTQNGGKKEGVAQLTFAQGDGENPEKGRKGK